jgi:hypothetical protein
MTADSHRCQTIIGFAQSVLDRRATRVPQGTGSGHLSRLADSSPAEVSRAVAAAKAAEVSRRQVCRLPLHEHGRLLSQRRRRLEWPPSR